jgi:hypothetical protein
LHTGPDAQRMVIVVLGDGYTEAELGKYAADVRAVLLEQALGNGYFGHNPPAFNVYRVDLASAESEVTMLGGPTHDTALGLVYTGSPDRCWIEESRGSCALIRSALASVRDRVPKVDHIVVMCNVGAVGAGGCSRGRFIYLTSNANGEIVEHELGHRVANLFDEYWEEGRSYTGSERINERNCSVFNDARHVAWRQVAAGVPRLSRPTEGCNGYQHGLFRPAEDCRMYDLGLAFCPVCEGLMDEALAASGVWRDEPALSNDAYLHVVVRVTAARRLTVFHAGEVRGTPVARRLATSDYLSLVTDRGGRVTVETIAEPPFTMRSYGGVRDAAHRTSTFGTPTLVVRVPGMTLARAAEEGFSCRLCAVRPTRTPDASAIEPAIADAIAAGGGGPTPGAFIETIAAGTPSDMARQIERFRRR